jgi:meso-butanediol dehydrogenase / (S,S)-butanediol dehydrogenase / diacetyl reductase
MGARKTDRRLIIHKEVDVRLAGKMALITGGGTGIGLAIAQRFVAEGAKICITGRRQDVLDEALRSFPAGTAIACSGSVSRDEDAERMVDVATAFGNRLDVLVNNAGISQTRGNVAALDPAVWREVIDVNLTGPFLVMKAAIPRMVQGGGGSVINISSLGGVRCMPEMPAYASSKAGLIMLTQQTALDFGPEKVRVNAICPGGVWTPMIDNFMRRYTEILQTDEPTVSDLVTYDVPLRRMAQPSEISGTCVYLASDDSTFTTGAVIMVDGGASVVDVGRVALRRAQRDKGLTTG